MIETLLQAILQQLDQPKKDLEHNLRALLSETISQMDLVSQAELDRQKTALNNANQQLAALQKQLTALETLFAQKSAVEASEASTSSTH